jgi:hypothetical protein
MTSLIRLFRILQRKKAKYVLGLNLIFLVLVYFVYFDQKKARKFFERDVEDKSRIFSISRRSIFNRPTDVAKREAPKNFSTSTKRTVFYAIDGDRNAFFTSEKLTKCNDQIQVVLLDSSIENQKKADFTFYLNQMPMVQKGNSTLVIFQTYTNIYIFIRLKPIYSLIYVIEN